VNQLDVGKILQQQAQIMKHHDVLALGVNRIAAKQQALEAEFSSLKERISTCLQHFENPEHFTETTKDYLAEITNKLKIIRNGLRQIDDDLEPVNNYDDFEG